MISKRRVKYSNFSIPYVISKRSVKIYLGPIVQSIVSLMRLLMTNSLTVVAEVFSNTLIFFADIIYSHFSTKNIYVFTIF